MITIAVKPSIAARASRVRSSRIAQAWDTGVGMGKADVASAGIVALPVVENVLSILRRSPQTLPNFPVNPAAAHAHQVVDRFARLVPSLSRLLSPLLLFLDTLEILVPSFVSLQWLLFATVVAVIS